MDCKDSQQTLNSNVNTPAVNFIVRGCGGSGKAGESGEEQQQEEQDAPFYVGASVYDASHHGACRGYGFITKAAEPAADGTPRWYVKFERGDRTTAVSEAYLGQCHIDHVGRDPPQSAGQRIVVVVGPHRGKEGVTVAKVGTTRGDGWVLGVPHGSCRWG